MAIPPLDPMAPLGPVHPMTQMIEEESHRDLIAKELSLNLRIANNNSMW